MTIFEARTKFIESLAKLGVPPHIAIDLWEVPFTAGKMEGAKEAGAMHLAISDAFHAVKYGEKKEGSAA